MASRVFYIDLEPAPDRGDGCDRFVAGPAVETAHETVLELVAELRAGDDVEGAVRTPSQPWGHLVDLPDRVKEHNGIVLEVRHRGGPNTRTVVWAEESD